MPIEMTGREFVQDVLGRCHEKERIEGRLGKDIYDVFNSGPALAKLQKVAGVLLDAMAAGTFISVQAAIDEESKLRLWEKLKKTQADFRLFASSPMYLKRLDVTDVGDIIRLVGAWVEKGGGRREENLAERKEAFRGGVGGGADKVWKQPSKAAADAQNIAGASSIADVHLARARSEGWLLEPQLKEFARDPAGFTGMGGIKKQGSKRLVSGTNLSIINRLFGLSWGCDISGTTCDELFAMDIWGARILGHPAYALLPLGAIVHNMHHTVLEVALPLSINDRIDYRVGFFDTLIPQQGLPAELEGIGTAIRRADSQMTGKHLLRYYENGRPVGCFRFADNEIQKLKKADISHARTLLQLVSTGRISVFPSRGEVEDLLRRYFN